MNPRILFFVALSACHFAAADVNTAPPAQLPSADATRVEVVTVQPSTTELELMLPGEVIGSRDVVMAAPAGGRVEAVNVRRGEEVRKGQSLLRVDAEMAGAQLAQAEAREEQARSEHERQLALGDLASEATIENARLNHKVADAGRMQAQAAYNRAALTAPFSGTVADLYVEAGSYTGPGQPVARLVELDTVRITLSVADRDVVSLTEGLEVSVRTNARAGLFKGTISHVGPAADLETRAFPVEVTVPNPDRLLLPGMIAQVRAYRELAKDTLIVPQEWVVTTRTEQGVFIEQDGFAQWRTVQLGEVSGNQVEVREGLSVGDRVIITGQRNLKAGETLLVSRTGTCCTDGRPTWGE